MIVLFGLACAATIVWRYWVFRAPGVPPGTDGGNWLAFGKDLLGTDIRRVLEVECEGSPAYPVVACPCCATHPGEACDR